MTGRNGNRSGCFSPNWSFRPEEITIAEMLLSSGYRTGHFGKWHLGAVKGESPVNPRTSGFEEYLSHDNFFEKDPPLVRNGAAPEIHEGESSIIVAQAAIDYMREIRAGGAPFFIVVHFGSPHGPYAGVEEDLAHYQDVENEESRHRFAEISGMDRALGMLRRELRDAGLADNTLFWFCSDNGIPGGESNPNAGLRGSKGNLYEGGLRVPGIIEWPSVVKEARQTSIPCVTSDILPTLAEIAGLPLPDRPLDGVSIAPLIRGEAFPERPKPIGFWKYPAGGEGKNDPWMDAERVKGTTPTTRNPGIEFQNYHHPTPRTKGFGGEAAWRENRLKLVVDGKGGAELFDIEADPLEKTDLAKERPEDVARMKAALEDWQRSVELSLTGADYR
jgi:arylsulfatase A-like enzyme